MPFLLHRLSAFCLGFGISFVVYSINIMGRPFSLGLFFSTVYMFLFFLKINKLPVVFEKFGVTLYLPLIFMFILAISNTLNASSFGFYFPFTFFCDWLLMLFILWHSLTDPQIPSIVLYGFALGTSALSILFFGGIGLDYQMTKEGLRVTMFGYNPNALSVIFSVGAVVILNKVVLQNTLNIRIIGIILLFFHYFAVFIMASRSGALILIGVAFASTLLYQNEKKIYKYFFVFLLSLCLCICVYYISQSDSVVVGRLTKSFLDGDTNGRTDIWSTYLKYFIKSPLLGYGYSGLLNVSIEAGLGVIYVHGVVSPFSPHNVFVELLMVSGVVGFVTMLVFFIKVFFCGIKVFLLKRDSTSVLLIIPLLVTMFAGQLLIAKYAWIVYAYLISSYYVNVEKNKP